MSGFTSASASALSIALLLFAESSPPAAEVKATFFACRDQAVFKKAFQRPAGAAGNEARAKSSSETYFKAKIATGDCVQLARAEQISIDQRAGDLWCVRPSGALECYWTVDKAIELYPSAAATASPQSRHTRSH